MKNIKFYNLSKFNKKYEKKFINDFQTINRNGRFVIGDFVKNFEKDFAK